MRWRVILPQSGQRIWWVTCCGLGKTCWIWEHAQGVTDWGWVTVNWKKEMVQEAPDDGAGAAKAWIPSISFKLMIFCCKRNHPQGGDGSPELLSCSWLKISQTSFFGTIGGHLSTLWKCLWCAGLVASSQKPVKIADGV